MTPPLSFKRAGHFMLHTQGNRANTLMMARLIRVCAWSSFEL